VRDSRQVLIASSDPVYYSMLSSIVGRLGMHTVHCASLSDARAQIDQGAFRVVLCADDLPDCNLRMALCVLTSATRGIPIIVTSHLADWEPCIKALDAGAFDYIACPPDPLEAERILRLALGLNPPLRRAKHTAA
jgi:DNA-binding NtrC family response regulator